jgi:hypothetical protein
LDFGRGVEGGVGNECLSVTIALEGRDVGCWEFIGVSVVRGVSSWSRSLMASISDSWRLIGSRIIEGVLGVNNPKEP